MEVGQIVPYISSVIPSGFLLCDGSAVSRDTYSGLFEVIGTTFGVGDGSTTFNLPDLSGRVAVGNSNNYAMASSSGEETHVLTGLETAQHTHEVPTHGHSNGITATVPALSHTVTQPATTYAKLNASGNSNGSSSPVTVYTNTTSAAMSRATNLSVAAHGATACTMSGGVTDAPAMVTSSYGTDDVAHDNMMPYLSLVYLIKYEPDVPPVLEPNMVMYGNSVMVMTAGGSYLKSRKSL